MTANRIRRVLAVVRHPVGGVRTHIIYTYPLLIEAGYRFTFVIPDHEAYDTFREDISSWEDVELIGVPHRDPGRSKPVFRPTVRKLLKQRRFALMHCHGLQAAIPAVLANLGIGIPHIMTSQDVFQRANLSGVVDRVKLFVLGRILRRLNALIAVSEDTRDDHLRYLPTLRKGPCRVEMIHNGIPVEQYTNPNGCPPANVRQRLSLGDDVYLIGFLGRFMEQKGFLVLIQALARLVKRNDLQPFHLVAVGSGDMLVNYKRVLDGLPEVSRLISFLEHAPHSAPILRELDLLVMPSLWEAHPLLPMEAMVVGVPVIGTSCLGLREVLQGSPNVMVPANNATELSQALLQAVVSPWHDAAEAYVPQAVRRFNVKGTATRLKALFDDVST